MQEIVKIILSLFLMFCSLEASPQEPYYIDFKDADGLPSNTTYKVFQDSTGYIWIATNNGISRFDGYEFLNFDYEDSLPDNVIFDIWQDGDSIWFEGQNSNLGYYYNGKFHRYKYNNLINKLKAPVSLIYPGSIFFDKNGTLFFTISPVGAFSIDKHGKLDTIKLTPKNHPKNFIIKLKNNKYLLGFNYYETDLVLPDGKILKKLNYKSRLYFDSRQSQNLLMVDNGIYDIEKNKWLINRTDKYISFSYYNDHDSLLWIHTNTGIFSLNLTTGIKSKNVFKTLKIPYVYRDREGGEWISTLTKGLLYVKDMNIQQINFNGTLGKPARIKHGNQIIFRNGDIFKIDTREHFKLPLKKRYVYDYMEYKDGYIIATRYGTFYVKSGITKKISKGSCHVIKNTGRYILLGEYDKLKIFDKELNIIYYSKIYIVSDLLPISDTSFFIASYAGLFLFDGHKVNKLFENSIPEGFRIIKYHPLFNIYVAGTKQTGLVLFNNEKSITINKTNGLSDNYIQGIFFDSSDIWVATKHGINVIKLKQDLSFTIESFTHKNGLPSNDISDIAVNKDTIYLITPDKLILLPKYSFYQKNIPPTLYLQKVKINGSEVKNKNNLILPYGKHLIELDIWSNNLRSLGDIEYTYSINNKKPITTKNRKIILYSLSPGTYTIKIITHNEDLISSNPVYFSFTIRKPFWKSIWFYILILLIIITITVIIFYAIYKVKTNEIKQRNKIKEQLIYFRHLALSQQMNPHFIFNTLTSIQNFIIKNDLEASSDYLAKFSKIMRMTLDAARNEKISLENEIMLLTKYLELEQLRTNFKFDFKIKIEKNINTTNVYIYPFMVQPIIENAVWHGIKHCQHKGLIEISVTETSSSVIFEVKDNGIGISKANEINKHDKPEHKSTALNIIKERLSLLSKKLGEEFYIKIYEQTNSNNIVTGTIVIIKIPKI